MTPYELQEHFDCMRPLVTDFELSCLLLSAGFPQRTALYWHTTTITNKTGIPKKFLSNDPKDAICAAPTAEELGRVLAPQYATIRVSTGYAFIDFMACGFKHAEAGVPGGGLVLQKMSAADDVTEAACKARGILLLVAAGTLQFEAKKPE